ncbi:coilin-like [Anguilla anguilla]|uniref:coilin-like n=1 Tax=Anguilla anguilla TaxID=7936 RepID=UPI0015B0A0ED|nr:coilin-like [Anguilla anguilla]
MSASSLNAVRVRLCFEYPPPAVSDCCMCWLFVDLKKCCVVGDLASIMREKFDFSPGTILNLFIDDCYLPPMETVYVLRDNDSIRVKVENQPPVNDIEASSKPEGQFQKANKRLREADEDNEGLRVKKKAPTESQKVDPQPVVEAKEKEKKKKNKSKEKTLPVKPPAAAAAAAPVKQTTPVKSPAVSKSATMPVATPPLPVPTPPLPVSMLSLLVPPPVPTPPLLVPPPVPTPPLPVSMLSLLVPPPVPQPRLPVAMLAMPALTDAANEELSSSSESSDCSEELPPEKGAEVNFPVPSPSWDSSPRTTVTKPVPKKTAPLRWQ